MDVLHLECARRARRGVSTNKGCARRPQRLLGWGEWELEVMEVVYVAMPAFGGEWEWGRDSWKGCM